MFTVVERDRLLALITDRARADDQVLSCALLGSAARGEMDNWSDIDVALRLSPAATLDDVAAQWTDWLTQTQDVADTLDIRANGALYRVFLLADSMQIDLSFWPDRDFRSTSEPMVLVFGDPVAVERPTPRDPSNVIATGWLYGLHARSAVKRGRLWQAEIMIAGLRDQIIALACLRHGLNPAQGRGAHQLPAEITQPLAASRAHDVSFDELVRSLHSTLAIYQAECAQHDPAKAAALAPALAALCSS